MSSTRTPALCAKNFAADKGDTVVWTNPDVNCTVSKDGTNPFPFISNPPSAGSSININPAPPTPAPTVTVNVDGTASGTVYYYQISCCDSANPIHTVTVGDGFERRKHPK